MGSGDVEHCGVWPWRPVGGASYTSRRVNAEFNWWLLIVGLVVGAGLVWFVLMDARRRDEDVDERAPRRPSGSRMLGRGS